MSFLAILRHFLLLLTLVFLGAAKPIGPNTTHNHQIRDFYFLTASDFGLSKGHEKAESGIPELFAPLWSPLELTLIDRTARFELNQLPFESTYPYVSSGPSPPLLNS